MAFAYNYRESAFKRRHLSSSSSARQSRFGTRHPSEEDTISNAFGRSDDDPDGIWNEESIPLLQKTVDQVKGHP